MKSRPWKMGLLATILVLVPMAAQASKKPLAKVTGVINLNHATPDQLKMLPGVKDKAVAAIVAHRDKQPFTRIEELATVKGFSKKRFEQLKPHLSVKGETTLKVEPSTSPSPRGRRAKKTKNH